MTEYLVEIRLAGTEAIPAEELARLRRAEAARAVQLAEAGILVRLWRTELEGWRNVGLWSATSEAELRAAIDSLPLARYMDVSWQALSPHPNDPAARGAQPLR